ncbi:MAG: hypothetical protein NT060_03125 [Candidatus Omnitrophica bacterium]|nr:hypothetical protein [Candidatus Omnitrophota bacterium]
MKPKTLYILLAVLIIAISISLLLTKEAVKTQPISQEIKPQETPVAPSAAAMVQAQQAYIPVEKRGAITIIKPLPQDTPRPPEIEKKKTAQAETTSTPATSGNNPSVSAGENTSSSPEKTTSGITKIGKQPSAEESKEMNTHGIVLW